MRFIKSIFYFIPDALVIFGIASAITLLVEPLYRYFEEGVFMISFIALATGIDIFVRRYFKKFHPKKDTERM